MVSKLAMARARAEYPRSILASLWMYPMPAAFHPDLLRTSLAPLTARQPLSAQAQDYQRFYGLNLSAHSWLGGFRPQASSWSGRPGYPTSRARRCSCCTAITTIWASTGM